MNTNWDVDLYLKYKKERTQPAIDLVNRIEISNPDRIVDIGCGPGNSTEILKNKWDKAEITGIDNSKQMIEKAKQLYPDYKWILSDVLDFKEPNEYDLVFSNAVIHWIPNHDKLISHLLSLLKPNGVIAIQVPQPQESPLHKALFEVASYSEFKTFTKEIDQIRNYNDGQYYYNLFQNKISNLYIWETTYYHIMESYEDIVNWFRGTGLRPYIERLPNTELEDLMVDSILEKCKKEYKKQSNGKVIFPFNRLFILGYA